VKPKALAAKDHPDTSGRETLSILYATRCQERRDHDVLREIALDWRRFLENRRVCFRIGAHDLSMRNFAAAGEFLFVSLLFSKAKSAA
jgi:hypothetical protein